MKKKIALMLAMVMAVATMLTGCGGKDVSGNYTANVNLVEFMEAVNEPIEDAGVDLSNLSIDFVMSLNADKTFNFDFDTTAFKDEFRGLMTDYVETVIDEILAGEGLTREDITDEVAQAMGYDTPDAFFDDFKNQAMAELDGAMEEMDAEISTLDMQGTYKVVKNTVIFSYTTEDNSLALDAAVINEDGTINLKFKGNNGEDYTFKFTRNQ